MEEELRNNKNAFIIVQLVAVGKRLNRLIITFSPYIMCLVMHSNDPLSHFLFFLFSFTI